MFIFTKMNKIRPFLLNSSKRLFPVIGHEGQQISNYGLLRRTAVPVVQFGNMAQRRFYSNESENKETIPNSSSTKLLPPLMAFPEIIWPSIIKSFRSFFFMHIIIRPYLDNDFNLKDFVAGTKQALQVVSTKLAEGDWDGVKDFVSEDIISELKENLNKMNVKQRHNIAIKKEDIYLSYPYQIGIIFDEANEKIQRRWVEITMVFHTIAGLQEILNKGDAPMNINNHPEYRDKITIANYRFIREYTKGMDKPSVWTINMLNEFKPVDSLQED